MLKRFIISLCQSLTCFACGYIVGMLKGNDNWFLVDIFTTMGTFLGTFLGYGYGKLDQGQKRNNQDDKNKPSDKNA